MIPTDDWWREGGLEGGKVELAAHQANNLYSLPSMPKRIAYLHACLGFPTKAAMLDAAAAGRLTGIPFATVSNIREHYPETKETPKGHLEQQRQGVRSTKQKDEWEQVDTSLTVGKKEQDVFVKV